MGGFDHATTGVLVLILMLIAPVIYYIHKARRGAELFVRRIPGIDAVDEAIGRTAELGRPASFTTGLTQLSPIVYACLGVLYYIARRVAVYRGKLLVPQSQSDVMAVTEDVLREAYRAESASTSFDSRSIMYLSDAQFAFAAGYMGLVQRERVGSAFLFGDFTAESLMLAEAGQQIGAMQVAATTSPEQVAFFICTCDYTLIGEELFAAAAYLTREPIQLGSLYGQDRAKLIFFVGIIIGIAIATYNSVVNSIAPGHAIGNLDALLRMSLW